MHWPKLTFPPINLYSIPLTCHTHSDKVESNLNEDNKMLFRNLDDHSFQQRIIREWNAGATLSQTVKRLRSRNETFDVHEVIKIWRAIYRQLKGDTGASIPKIASPTNYICRFDDDNYPAWRGPLHNDGTPLVFYDSRTEFSKNKTFIVMGKKFDDLLDAMKYRNSFVK